MRFLAAVLVLALLVAVACGAALPFPAGPAAPGPVPKETLKGEESVYYPLAYTYPIAYSYYPVAYWG